MVDYTSAFEKPFTDIKKLIIGILFSILPIINWFAVGFILECSGVGKTKPSKKMPEWKNFGNLFIKGFFNFLISIIYFLPAIIIFIVGVGSLMVQLLTLLSLEDISNAATDEAKMALISPIIDNLRPLLINAIPFIIFSTLLFLVAIYVIPIAVLSYLQENNFSGAFKFKRIFKKAFTGKYFVAWILMAFIGILFSIILGLIPYVGSAIYSFIIGVISFSLFGQVYLETEIQKKKK
ncbi:MAG: DUF4013 domain-containing protein [Candidatus Pacearchaeota archaeon]